MYVRKQWFFLTFSLSSTKQMLRSYVERRANTPHWGSRGFTPVDAQLRDQFFQRRRRERYVIGKRGLLYRDEEIETAQIENVEFLKFI